MAHTEDELIGHRTTGSVTGSPTRATTPPGTWGDPATHYLRALRSPWFRILVELEDCIGAASVVFWKDRGVCMAHLPLTTGAVSSPVGLGSDSKPVRIDLDGVPTYLADSMQFMLEYVCRLTRGGAWYLMPSFRGEDADATHLNQFFHSEAELPGGLNDIVVLVEDYIRHLTEALLSEHEQAITAAAGGTDHLESLLSSPAGFRRVRFDDAVALLDAASPFVEHHEGPEGPWRTITRAGERQLLQKFGDFVWLTHFDHLAVPFYQGYANGDTRTALNADLLFGPGEVVGAGERHASAEEARFALEQHRVEEAEYGWYLRMKDEFPLSTAGFGLGVERFLMWVLRHDDIRDMQLVPRFHGIQIVP